MNDINTLSFEDSGKVLGPTDGMEGFPCEEWINVSCSISNEKISFVQAINNLKIIYPELLKKFPQFRLKIVKIKDYYHWQYAEDKEIKFEEIISIQKEESDELIPLSFPLEVLRLYTFPFLLVAVVDIVLSAPSSKSISNI